MDANVDLFRLLTLEVERIGTRLLRDLEYEQKEYALSAPDAELVEVRDLGERVFRITVRTPRQFAGYYLDVSREKPLSSWELSSPDD